MLQFSNFENGGTHIQRGVLHSMRRISSIFYCCLSMKGLHIPRRKRNFQIHFGFEENL